MWLARLWLTLTAAHAADPPTDEEITRAVDLELAIHEGEDAFPIDVTTRDGIVTLEGEVSALLTRERAVRIATAVRGVRSVVDELRVDPPEREDRELLEAIRSRFVSNPVTESWEVDIAVSNGVATLTGEVESWHEKELAGRLTRDVAGLRAVKNRLEWDIPRERRASEIEAEVKSNLRWDVRLADVADDIEVTVRGGRVRMQGVVGSAIERDLAGIAGWVTGVRSVDTSGLDVRPWVEDERLRDDPIPPRTDREIRQAIEEAWFYDPRVSPWRPEVAVEDGYVTLTGVVRSAEARMAAEADARNTVGVWGVSNLVRVRPLEPPEAGEIQANITSSLASDPYFSRGDVTVDVKNGVATLSGVVDSAWARGRAGQIAARADGVVRVDNDILVNLDSKRLGYTDPITGDLGWIEQSDAELVADVERQLFWSPFVDADAIEVRADAGVVTLVGEVDSWFERTKAVENAYEAGARSVRNQLVVTAPEGPQGRVWTD